jgi:hypothetical protein
MLKTFLVLCIAAWVAGAEAQVSFQTPYIRRHFDGLEPMRKVDHFRVARRRAGYVGGSQCKSVSAIAASSAAVHLP